MKKIDSLKDHTLNHNGQTLVLALLSEALIPLSFLGPPGVAKAIQINRVAYNNINGTIPCPILP